MSQLHECATLAIGSAINWECAECLECSNEILTRANWRGSPIHIPSHTHTHVYCFVVARLEASPEVVKNRHPFTQGEMPREMTNRTNE